MIPDVVFLKAPGARVCAVGDNRLRLRPGQVFTATADVAADLVADGIAVRIEPPDPDEGADDRGRGPVAAPWPLPDDD